MQPDRLYNVTQLISPPPEEILRRSSRQVPFSSPFVEDHPSFSAKRKRHARSNGSLQQGRSPNPKPRKHAKQLAVGPESPTRPNIRILDINTISHELRQFSSIPQRASKAETDPAITPPDVRPSRTRRSVTPIPSYDPPSVVFTPPREVIGTPTISKSSKRKTKSKVHSKPTTVKIIPVKKELPDIDLSVPMPPPSPSEDPILLSGPSGPFASTPSRRHNCAQTSVVNTLIQADVSPTSNLAPSDDRHDSEGVAFYDWREHTRPASSTPDSASMIDVRPSDAEVARVDLPIFNLNDLPPSSDFWSDSDDDAIENLGTTRDAGDEGEGEYTGKWKTLLVKTKQDPPSSVTRARIEQWGRPISPFPAEANSLCLQCDSDDDANDQLQVYQNSNEELDQDLQDALEEEEVRRISAEPDGEPGGIVTVGEMHNNESPLASVAPLVDPNLSSEPDLYLGEGVSAVKVHHNGNYAEITLTEKVEGIGSPDALSCPVTEKDTVNNRASMDGGYDGSSDGESEESFVKISSADPHAAARAAAILKQYNYDCFTEISKSKRRRSGLNRLSRRSTDIGEALARTGILEGRIEKASGRRRNSVGTGVIGSQVFVSGVQVTTLGSLLKDAEAEVSFSSTPQASTKKAYDPPFPTHPEQSVDDFNHSLLGAFMGQREERQWTKGDWRLLDSCFTDERIALGNERQGDKDGLADVRDIDLDNVVQRYIDSMGGDIERRFGRDWDREFVLQRAKALRKKQCSGYVAPPTTPLLSYPIGSGMRPTPDLDIPDFTPLRERLAARQTIRDITSPRNWNATSQILLHDKAEHSKLPTSLLAPRYMHLLEEAIAIDNGSVMSTEGASPQPEAEITDPAKMPPPTTPTTIGGRVKGFLYSYLPSLSKYTSNPPTVMQRRGLPLPPPDILGKLRGPITTPARPPPPKHKHPKELVQLQPAPLPAPKASMIPRLAEPQRLVKLNPIPPPEPQEVIPVSTKPRTSNGSVKELVECFEELRKAGDEEKLKPKPAWRP